MARHMYTEVHRIMRYTSIPHASILPPTPKVFEEYKATTPKPILEHRNHADNPCIHSPCYPMIYSMVFNKKYIENNNTIENLMFSWYLINILYYINKFNSIEQCTMHWRDPCPSMHNLSRTILAEGVI